MRFNVSLLVGTLVVLGFQAPAAAGGGDLDCADFPSQRAAQLWFLNHDPASDPSNLDADGDGVVCESNPPPYYYGSDPTPGGDGPTPAPEPEPRPIRVVRVIDGELVKVREGTRRPFVVHLMGVKVPRNACKAKAAKQELRSWVKRGMVVKVRTDRRAPERDKKGHLWRTLVRAKGGWDVGGSQVRAGYAQVERRIRFVRKGKYLRWERKARSADDGYFGEC